MSNLHSHALAEFRAAGWTDDDGKFKEEMQEAICKHVLELLKVFADEGHSGSTAPYAANMFKKLAMFEPLVPLTGEDWEWSEVSPGVFQNKRCGRVFKQADRFNGQAYDLDGRVFYEWAERDLDPDEKGYPGKRRFQSYYTSRESMVPITFPYTPTTEHVERPWEEA
jgi:hypothetical protein